ncbi:MAG: hypothetical protein AB7V77_02880 [Candidatus Woesearchaeota archaeon]
MKWKHLIIIFVLFLILFFAFSFYRAANTNVPVPSDFKSIPEDATINETITGVGKEIDLKIDKKNYLIINFYNSGKNEYCETSGAKINLSCENKLNSSISFEILQLEELAFKGQSNTLKSIIIPKTNLLGTYICHFQIVCNNLIAEQKAIFVNINT